MKDLQGKYKEAITKATLNANSLITNASTRIRRCDPPQQIRGETYLEMEKLLQGIVVHELTLSPNNTTNWPCSDYHGVSYYPRKAIWSGGDWKCHGKMYNCFKSYLKIICKPSTPNRRIDGFTAENLKFPGFRDGVSLDMGNVTNCYINKLWTKKDWAYLDEFTFYEDKECACICDDFQHPKTLRSFSSQNVVTDYRNNMVMTGIRLINVSNVIHFDIQQGKLEKFGFINSSTVHWRSRSEMENENVASSWEPITLNYGMRGLYLDTIHVESSEAIIGVRFQWDLSKENVAFAVLVGKVDFPNGQVLPTIDRWLSKDWFGDIRTEVILNKPHMPTLCTRNIPMREDNKFIRFHTTDWVKDAAQSTIPYLDIQAVVTNPPSLIGGVGFNYRHASECGGYIAVELYSFNYSEWITKISIPTVAIKKRFNLK